MLAQYKRRYRDYTGPTPNSVAIRAKPTRRRPAEHLILERRRKEDLVQGAEGETKFIKQCDLKSSWVKAMNKRIERNTLRRRVQQELQKETLLLDDRREKLREMLLDEERSYIDEMENMQVTTLERQAKMRERAKQLKEKRELERREFVDQKLDQQWRDQCEEFRSIQSKSNQDEVCMERNEQILLKEEERKQKEEMEKMFANLWESDRLVKSEREEQTAKYQIERNRESLKVLQVQIAANDQKLVEEKKLKEMEAEWLKEETKLRREEEEWMTKEKLRKQEHAKRVRDASIKLKMKKEVKEKEEDQALERQILEKLVEDSRHQAQEDAKRKTELREENLRFMAYVEQNRKDEKDREESLDKMVYDDVELQWQKKAAKYKSERVARRKLLENVLENRQQQMVQKKAKTEQLKQETEREREELFNVMNEHKRMEQESSETLKQRNLSYQKDLEMQIGYQQKTKAKEKDDDFQEYLAGKETEKEYQRKLSDVLSRPQSEKLHPSRRLMERQRQSAH